MKHKETKSTDLPSLLVFALFFFIMVWGYHFIANINIEQKKMKRYVREKMEDPSSFRKVFLDQETVTIGDEIDGKITYFSTYRDSISGAVADYHTRRARLAKTITENPLMAEIIKVYDNTCHELEYEVKQCDSMLTYLNRLKQDDKLCKTEAIAVYTLIYEDGGITHTCCGRYDIKNRRFISMRIDDGPWDILNDYKPSIPAYMEKLTETGFRTIREMADTGYSALPAWQGQDKPAAGK